MKVLVVRLISNTFCGQTYFVCIFLFSLILYYGQLSTVIGTHFVLLFRQ